MCAAAVVGVLAATGLVLAREGGPSGQPSDPRAQSERIASAERPTSSNPVTDGDGSEVIRQGEGTKVKGMPGLRQAKRVIDRSFLTAPLPASASAVDAVAKGFPVSVIPLLGGASVQSSGVSTTSTAMQVSIVASSSKSPKAVLGFYRKALSARGFVEGSAPAVGGSTASKFKRGAEHLMVTTTARGSNTTYSLFGTLHVRARS